MPVPPIRFVCLARARGVFAWCLHAYTQNDLYHGAGVQKPFLPLGTEQTLMPLPVPGGAL